MSEKITRSKVTLILFTSFQGKEAVNCLVGVSLEAKEEKVLVSGHDFYCSPAVGPNGKLAYLACERQMILC